jgi:tetratricopeptide (TPR) repeat protein
MGVVEPEYVATSGAIAIENLDQQIAQGREQNGVEELLLTRARFLGDHDALYRAATMSESRIVSGTALLHRARMRLAVHRFGDALADIADAEGDGAPAGEVRVLRASVLISIGRAEEAIGQLEPDAGRVRGFAEITALASAYAALGRLEDADRLYRSALDGLETTSPFPYAWAYFARGVMWTEEGADSTRGAELYAAALAYLPEFVAASIHLAELESARGDTTTAMLRLERVVVSTGEPEALALLGTLHVQAGDAERGWRDIATARRRYRELLSMLPLAFADHAAEFYLGPGADVERAQQWAQENATNRPTKRAMSLALRASVALGRE